MKNLIGIGMLGVFLYVIMGGTLPSFTHYLESDSVVYDDESVVGDDVFVGLHVVQGEDGLPEVRGVSHRGRLLTHTFWSRIFQRDPAVERSYIVQSQQEQARTPCEVDFEDIDDSDEGLAIDLLSDLCIVRGVDNKFYPENDLRRADVLVMVAGWLDHIDVLERSSQSTSDYDIPTALAPALDQLAGIGLDAVLARDSVVFGPDDILQRQDAIDILDAIVAQLDGHSGAIVVPRDMDR
jgi:hypothetical protein